MFFDIKVPELNEELRLSIFEKRQLRQERKRAQQNYINSADSIFTPFQQPLLNIPLSGGIDFSNIQRTNRDPQDILSNILNYSINDCFDEIWLCEIIKPDEKYGFERNFYKRRKILKEENIFTCRYEIFDNKIYEYCDIKHRCFFKVENSKIKPLTKNLVVQFFKEKSEDERKLLEISKKVQKYKFIMKN
jgi:hypothetical protein